VTVNAGQSYAWSSAFQSPSAQPDSRGITRGTWRGNNVVHSFNIPAANLRAGVNTIEELFMRRMSGGTVRRR